MPLDRPRPLLGQLGYEAYISMMHQHGQTYRAWHELTDLEHLAWAVAVHTAITAALEAERAPATGEPYRP